MRTATLICLSALAVPALAQEPLPDTTAPWHYYPLGMGDVWQYEVERYQYWHCQPCRYKEVREVVGFETIGERTYAVLRSRTYDFPPFLPNPPAPISQAYVRFDTAAAAVMSRYVPTGQEYYADGGGCRLDEAFPTPPDTTRAITCPGIPPAPWPGYEPVVRGGYDLPLPFSGFATQKAFRYLYGFGIRRVVYAAGIGLLAMGGFPEVDDGEFWTLHYARVGGVEYGSPIVVGSEPGPSPPALTLAAEPNPATGIVRLTLDVPVAGTVVVEAFDALGRRVHREERALAAGAHKLPLDTSGWAPGLFVIRTTADGASAATRVVRQ